MEKKREERIEAPLHNKRETTKFSCPKCHPKEPSRGMARNYTSHPINLRPFCLKKMPFRQKKKKTPWDHVWTFNLREDNTGSKGAVKTSS